MNQNKKTDKKIKYNDQQVNTNQLPIIRKIPIFKKLNRSNSYLTSFPKGLFSYKNFSKKIRVISHGSYGIDVQTKLYRINDYLNQSNKFVNSFKIMGMFQGKENKNENTEIKKKDEMVMIKADTGLTYTNFFQRKNIGLNPSNSARVSKNELKLNVNSKNNNNNENEMTGINQGKINDIKIDNNNYGYVIKKLNNYNLNLLKNSRYFSHTKYINKPKNINKHISKSCSTKNLSLENTRSTSTLRRTMNDIRVEKLLNKQKLLEENEKKLNEENSAKKMEEIGTITDKDFHKSNAIFYDFIPIILQHLKQRENEEISKENDWIYNKINSLYIKKFNRKENYTTLRAKNGEFIFENPIIKYLFLEKTLYNLRHTVKFIDIKNQEQLEKNVLKVIGDEYKNLKEKKFTYDINDFTTFGYEFDPKFFVQIQQEIHKLDLQKYFNEIKSRMDRSAQKNSSTKMSIFTNKAGFFTTNKSEYKNPDKTLKSKEEKSKEDKSKSSSDGFLSKIFKNSGIHSRIRRFEGFKIKEKEKNQEIDSNKAQSISNLILKDTEIKLSDDVNSNNENILNNDELATRSINIEDNTKEIEKEKEKEKDSHKMKDNNPIPNLLFQNDRLRMTQPPIQNNAISTLTKQLMDKEKRISAKKPKKDTKNIDINRNNLDFSKVTPVVSTSLPKEKIKIRPSKPQIRNLNIKKTKKRKKSSSNDKSSRKSKDIVPSDYDIIRTSVQLKPINEENKESPKREIKNAEEYEEYKKEMIEKSNLEKEFKEKVIEQIKNEEKKNTIRRPRGRISGMNFSPIYQRLNTFNFDYEKKFEKIKRDDKIKFGDDNLLTELKNRKKEMEDKESEEEEEEEDDDYSDSVSSSDYEGLEMLDVSKELENKGDIMKKKWMENSPKFKNRILDFSNRRRHAISAANYEIFDDLAKNERITKLSDKIKFMYDKLKKRRKEKKKKKKNRKINYFNFMGVDLTNVDEIEKKKKVHLFRLKEDIKYKIMQGKYHLIEIENFKHFENAMNKFRLKDSLDPKKVRLYINLVKKYLHFYKAELDKKEKEKNDEDRINRFLRILNHEIYEKIPEEKQILGRHCRSVDYYQELLKLSELHGFLM